MNVEINDVIRSYDFKPMYGRPDCFVEGRVVSLTKHAIEIRVLVDEFDGKRHEELNRGSRVGEVFLVPRKVSIMEYAGRVMNLSRI